MPARPFRFLVLVAAASGTSLLLAPPASAHTGQSTNGLTDGWLHPLSGLDHLLAMVAVGIVAATAAQGVDRWFAPLAFVAGMALGGAAGLLDVAFPPAEQLIVASVILLGLAIAASQVWRARLAQVGLGLVAVAGFAHGHAHGAEAPATGSAFGYVLGFVAATVLLHLAGVTLCAAVADRKALRVGTGALTATAGALLILAA
jgi:urease accessory protein